MALDISVGTADATGSDGVGLGGTLVEVDVGVSVGAAVESCTIAMGVMGAGGSGRTTDFTALRAKLRTSGTSKLAPASSRQAAAIINKRRNTESMVRRPSFSSNYSDSRPSYHTAPAPADTMGLTNDEKSTHRDVTPGE
jgi:hypothetical protein